MYLCKKCVNPLQEEGLCDDMCLNFGEAMKTVVSDVRKYKTENGVSMKEPLECLTIISTVDNLKLLKDSVMDIQACTHTRNIEVENSDGETKVEIKPIELNENLDFDVTPKVKSIGTKK